MMSLLRSSLLEKDRRKEGLDFGGLRRSRDHEITNPMYIGSALSNHSSD